MQRSTVRKIAKVGLGIAVSVGISYFINHLLQEHYRKIAISRETTYVLGPTFPDGYVDFLAALDAQFSQGVTADNNAAVPLFQAIGLKDSVSADDRSRVLAALQMPDLPDDDSYFVFYNAFYIQKMIAASPTGSIDKTEASYDADDLMDLRRTAPWGAEQDPVTAEWLRVSAPQLQLAVQASRRPILYFPFCGRPGLGTILDAHSPALGSVRGLAASLACRSTLSLHNGDIPSWREDFLAQQRLGRLLMRSPTVIQAMVGIHLIDDANFQIQAAIPHLSAAQTAQVLVDLRTLPAPHNIVDCLDHCERLGTLATFSTFARFGTYPDRDQPLPAPISLGCQFPIHFDDLMRLHNHLYDHFITGLRQPTYSQRLAAQAALNTECSAAILPGDDVTSNLKCLIGQAINYSAARLVQDRMLQSSRLAQLALLLHLYHLEHNAYPAKLDDIPNRLDSDLDIFADDAPIHYKLADGSCLIYSINSNLRDDGGEHLKLPNPRGVSSALPPGIAVSDDIAFRLQP